MSQIPFDTRSVKYDEHHFIKEIPKNEIGIPDDSLAEPYNYFNAKSSKRGTGFGNVRHQRKNTFLNRRQAVEEVIVTKPEDLKNPISENGDSANKGIGVLVEPSSENKASAVLVPNQTQNHSRNKRSTKRKSKNNSLNNSPIISVAGRSAFKPSLIDTSDHSQKSPQNRKRTKKDIFGIY
jgi:hypothetical protein